MLRLLRDLSGLGSTRYKGWLSQGAVIGLSASRKVVVAIHALKEVSDLASHSENCHMFVLLGTISNYLSHGMIFITLILRH